MRGASMMLALAAVMLAAVAPTAAAALPLSHWLPEIASGLCSSVIADPAILPPAGDEEAAFFRKHGLEPGVTRAAAVALGDALAPSRSETRYASGRADDGAFVVFIDRDQSEYSCGAIVYEAPPGGELASQVQRGLVQSATGWRSLPPRDASYLGLVGPGTTGRPRQIILLNAPAQPGPEKLFMALEALSPNAPLPEGF